MAPTKLEMAGMPKARPCQQLPTEAELPEAVCWPWMSEVRTEASMSGLRNSVTRTEAYMGEPIVITLHARLSMIFRSRDMDEAASQQSAILPLRGAAKSDTNGESGLQPVLETGGALHREVAYLMP